MTLTISQELSRIDEDFLCAIARIWQWRHPAVLAVCRLYPTYKVTKNLEANYDLHWAAIGSSVDSSAPSIRLPLVRIPSKVFHKIYLFVQYTVTYINNITINKHSYGSQLSLQVYTISYLQFYSIPFVLEHCSQAHYLHFSILLNWCCYLSLIWEEMKLR